jgi:hypothetical protein
MAINQITTSNTFGQWVTTTQSIIALANTLTDGNGATFTANTILSVSGTGSFLNVANVAKINTIVFYDGTTLSSNAGSIAANNAYDKANSANVLAQAAYDKANSANVLAQAAYDNSNTDVTSITISSGTYGNASITPVITVAANGRVSGISNVSMNLNQITAGAISISSGNVGISTGSPSANLDVSGSVNFSKANYLSQTLTDGATINWDTSAGVIATVTLGGNRTMAAPTNLKVGTYILHVIQDGSGNRTLTWNSVFKWTAATAPTLTTAANRRDIFSFICDGTNLYGSFLPDVR